MNKLSKSLIVILVLSVSAISCNRKYTRNLKSENVKEIITFIENNYKISSPQSYIRISFQKPSQFLGDVRYGYDTCQITEKGNVEVNREIPNELISFCHRNDVILIEVVYIKDQAQNPHPLIILELKQRGLSRKKTIVYFKDEKFYFPGQLNEKFISEKIYLISTHMDIM